MELASVANSFNLHDTIMAVQLQLPFYFIFIYWATKKNCICLIIQNNSYVRFSFHRFKKCKIMQVDLKLKLAVLVKN